MMITDDLPWPELGNVSRGATRGNQGQKGVLGPPDGQGRCVLQLRVQPGVLSVKLNRQASEWYRILDNEVDRALKLTKTYWRKARRRQDYDARADQDHMELHEWLQQLKDKTMSHLELLMQKGDIPGPPYTMPDDVELSFLKKFIERQAAGTPHNPRLRLYGAVNPSSPFMASGSVGSISPEPDHAHIRKRSYDEHMDDSGSGFSHTSSPSMRSAEPSLQDAYSSEQLLQGTRINLSKAQKNTQEALLRYTSCLEAERRARQELAAMERHRSEIMQRLISNHQGPPAQTAVFSDSIEMKNDAEDLCSLPEGRMNSSDIVEQRTHNTRPIEWPMSGGVDFYPRDGTANYEVAVPQSSVPDWNHYDLQQDPQTFITGPGFDQYSKQSCNL